jgi:hypothetical protein
MENTQSDPPPIEDMSLEALSQSVMDLPDEQLLEYMMGTRNNRNKAPEKKSKRKKKEVSPELLAMQSELQALLDSSGVSLEDLLGDL